MDRLTRANALLASQHAKLSAVLASPAPPEVRSLARRYLAKVRHWQAEPEAARVIALGLLGKNGLGPAVDDVCRQAAFHASRVEAAVHSDVKRVAA